MGHRALVTYERDAGRYDVHYSHWGGADLRLARELESGRSIGAGNADATIDPDPIAEGLLLTDVVADCVDFLGHEALFVVSSAGEVTAYRVCWFGVHTANGVVEGDPSVGRGALLSVDADDPRDDGYVLGWVDGIRECAGDLVDRGALDDRDLVPYLVDRFDGFAADEREFVLDPLVDRG